jgi:hypothetical protein
MKRLFHTCDHDRDHAHKPILPELHITLASLPFAAFTRLDKHYSSHLNQAFNQGSRVSIESNLFGYA